MKRKMKKKKKENKEEDNCPYQSMEEEDTDDSERVLINFNYKPSPMKLRCITRNVNYPIVIVALN